MKISRTKYRMNEDIQSHTVLSEKQNNSQVHNNNKRFEKSIKTELEESPSKMQIIQDPTPASRKRTSTKRKRNSLKPEKSKSMKNNKNAKTEPKVKSEPQTRKVKKVRYAKEKFIPPPILSEPQEKLVGKSLAELIPPLPTAEMRLKVENIGDYGNSRKLSFMPGEGL